MIICVMTGILSHGRAKLCTFIAIDEEKKNKPFEGVKIYDKARLNHVETEVKNPLPSSQGKLPLAIYCVLFWLLQVLGLLTL